LEEVQERANFMLKEKALATLPRTPLRFAIDSNRIPYGQGGR
jgi:hypothetical protein